MAKRGGFMGGGMPGNMNNLMKQAQRMQRQMEQQQAETEKKFEELAAKEFTASAGGGAVTVKVSGEGLLNSVVISPEAVDPDDVETLQDMITAAVNEGLKQVQKETEAIQGSASQGIPGLSGLGF